MAISTIGIVGIAAAAVVVGSILAGEVDSTSSGNSGGVDQDGEKCEGCRSAKRWWNSLSRWKKAAYLVWYGYKKAQCNLSGCPF
jgi:hypothetical protein